jgi:predicted nucleic acid-binding protein
MNAGKRGRRVREHPSGPAAFSGRLYLESSALLAGVLESELAVIRAIEPSNTSMSALTIAEARRAIQRAQHSGRITALKAERSMETITQLEASCTVLDITDVILARAGRRFPAEPVRTLDAIHLASAELLDDPTAPVTILTRDRRIRENAELMGMRVG